MCYFGSPDQNSRKNSDLHRCSSGLNDHSGHNRIEIHEVDGHREKHDMPYKTMEILPGYLGGQIHNQAKVQAFLKY